MQEEMFGSVTVKLFRLDPRTKTFEMLQGTEIQTDLFIILLYARFSFNELNKAIQNWLFLEVRQCCVIFYL